MTNQFYTPFEYDFSSVQTFNYYDFLAEIPALENHVSLPGQFPPKFPYTDYQIFLEVVKFLKVSPDFSRDEQVMLASLAYSEYCSACNLDENAVKYAGSCPICQGNVELENPLDWLNFLLGHNEFFHIPCFEGEIGKSIQLAQSNPVFDAPTTPRVRHRLDSDD